MFDHIHFYFATTVYPIGIVLNAVSLYVFTRATLAKHNVFGYLYAWLCLLNMLALASETSFSVCDFLNVEPLELSDSACRFFYFWKIYVDHIPAFLELIVVVCLYLDIRLPRARTHLERYRHALIAIDLLGIFLVDCIYFAYSLQKASNSTANSISNIIIDSNQTSNSHKMSNGGGGNKNSTYVCTTQKLVDFSADIVNIAMRDFIPFVSVFVFNLLALLAYRRVQARRHLTISNPQSIQQQHRNHHHQQQQPNHRKSAHDEHLEKSGSSYFMAIFAQNAIFLIIYTPWSAFFIIVHLNQSFGLFPNIVAEQWFVVVWDVVNCVSFLNAIQPFFIHLTFNPLFREELVLSFKKMLCCCLQQRKLVTPESSSPSTSPSSSSSSSTSTPAQEPTTSLRS